MSLTDVYIGGLIRAERCRQGMTQLTLSHKLGYDSVQFVSLFERGFSKCPPPVLGKLSIILGKGFPLKLIIRRLNQVYKENLIKQIEDGKKLV